MTIKNPTTCNQCHEQMYGCALVDMAVVHYCAKPECPNYALSQFSVEEMIKLGEEQYLIK